MIKQIIDISQAAYIRMQHQQLIIEQKGSEQAAIPIEDIGVLILQHPAIVLTQAALIGCQKNNVAIIFCDDTYVPYSIVLPLCRGHTLHSKILRQQLKVSRPTQKRVWQSVVQQKILQQLQTIRCLGGDSKKLQRLAQQVKSGDSNNHEAQAAQHYWKILMGDNFIRDRSKMDANVLLNYGYAIIRAMIARAIVAGGLHPALGVHHHNQYNALCLADDLMEPFRPWVDFVVVKQQPFDGAGIAKEQKRPLLQLLSQQVSYSDQSMPLMVACHYLMADVKKALFEKGQKIHYPLWKDR